MGAKARAAGSFIERGAWWQEAFFRPSTLKLLQPERRRDFIFRTPLALRLDPTQSVVGLRVNPASPRHVCCFHHALGFICQFLLFVKFSSHVSYPRQQTRCHQQHPRNLCPVIRTLRLSSRPPVTARCHPLPPVTARCRPLPPVAAGIGFGTVSNISIRKAKSRLRGSTQALCISSKFQQCRFEFVFTSLVKNSPRLFTTVQAVLRSGGGRKKRHV